MKLLILAPIKHLYSNKELVDHELLMGFRLSNNYSLLEASGNFKSEFMTQFGGVNYDLVMNRKFCFVYQIYSDIPDKSDLSILLDTASTFINIIIGNLWYIRDCNLCAPTSFLYIMEGDKNLSLIVYKDYYFNTSKGGRLNYIYSKDLFDELIKICERELYYSAVVNQKAYAMVSKDNREGFFNSNAALVPYNSFSRFSRAKLFLHQARAIDVIPVKITNYIASLECLFSLHKEDKYWNIKNRIAQFLNDPEFDLSLFASAYTIRNKYIHGQLLIDLATKKEPSSEIILKLSEFSDSLCRKMFRKVIESDPELFMKSNKDLIHYFASFRE